MIPRYRSEAFTYCSSMVKFLSCLFRYPTMTRFFAHLCLFLQIIDISPPPLATQTILEAYLQVLEVAQNLYLSHVPNQLTHLPYP